MKMTIIRNYDDFAFTWHHNKQYINYISFDHDLGNDNKTGYNAICLIEKDYYHGIISHDIELNCHSANPVGAARINQVIENIKKRR